MSDPAFPTLVFVFMGTPAFSVPALGTVAGAHEVVCAYTQPPRPAGRGKKDRPTPVHQRAEALAAEGRVTLVEVAGRGRRCAGFLGPRCRFRPGWRNDLRRSCRDRFLRAE